jgi:hypothetical protein
MVCRSIPLNLAEDEDEAKADPKSIDHSSAQTSQVRSESEKKVG